MYPLVPIPELCDFDHHLKVQYYHHKEERHPCRVRRQAPLRKLSSLVKTIPTFRQGNLLWPAGPRIKVSQASDNPKCQTRSHKNYITQEAPQDHEADEEDGREQLVNERCGFGFVSKGIKSPHRRTTAGSSRGWGSGGPLLFLLAASLVLWRAS